MPLLASSLHSYPCRVSFLVCSSSLLSIPSLDASTSCSYLCRISLCSCFHSHSLFSSPISLFYSPISSSASFLLFFLHHISFSLPRDDSLCIFASFLPFPSFCKRKKKKEIRPKDTTGLVCDFHLFPLFFLLLFHRLRQRFTLDEGIYTSPHKTTKHTSFLISCT